MRPTNSREKKLGEPIAVFPKGGMTVECEEEGKKNTKFDFDAVFGNDSTQDQIFDECRDLVQSVLDGYNITIFAYGQTSGRPIHTGRKEG